MVSISPKRGPSEEAKRQYLIRRCSGKQKGFRDAQSSIRPQIRCAGNRSIIRAASGEDWFINDSDVPSVLRMSSGTIVASADSSLPDRSAGTLRHPKPREYNPAEAQLHRRGKIPIGCAGNRLSRMIGVRE